MAMYGKESGRKRMKTELDRCEFIKAWLLNLAQQVNGDVILLGPIRHESGRRYSCLDCVSVIHQTG